MPDPQDAARAADLLEVRGLRKSFPIAHGGGRHNRLWALDGVDLRLGRRETLGLVGETGCGKSTLARVLLRLERPEEGMVRFGDVDAATLKGKSLVAWRRRVQMVFQDPYSSLNSRMTAAAIIAEPWRTHRDVVPAAKRAGRVAELLEMVGMRASDGQRYPSEFSGGQRQRIGIARALALEPEIIVCDEPLSALDLSVQAQVLNLLTDLQARLGVSYIFISHDLSVVRYLASRVAVMYLGKIVETGPTKEVFANPRHPYTAALLSSAPSLNAAIAGATERIVLAGDLPSPVNPPSGCRFRTRCWQARDSCAEIVPPLAAAEAAPEQLAACHFPLPPGFPHRSDLTVAASTG